VIWGTDDNSVTVEEINGNLIISSDVVARTVEANRYTLVEDELTPLPQPFFVGYYNYENGLFNLTNSYLYWNNKTHACINNVINEYEQKSIDPQYSDEERIAFGDYAEYLYLSTSLIHPEGSSSPALLPPYWTFKTPPDENEPYYPECWWNQ
jgi:hypothetical protein